MANQSSLDSSAQSGTIHTVLRRIDPGRLNLMLVLGTIVVVGLIIAALMYVVGPAGKQIEPADYPATGDVVTPSEIEASGAPAAIDDA